MKQFSAWIFRGSLIPAARRNRAHNRGLCGTAGGWARKSMRGFSRPRPAMRSSPARRLCGPWRPQAACCSQPCSTFWQCNAGRSLRAAGRIKLCPIKDRVRKPQDGSPGPGWIGIPLLHNRCMAAQAAGKRKRQLLPRRFRKELAKLARRYAHVFDGKPTLKNVAVRYFRALLQPHRRSGRPCEQRITTASRLFKTYRKRYSTETYSATWARVYPVAIPGLDDLPPREASEQKRGLRSAVRARPNARRRRRAKAK